MVHTLSDHTKMITNVSININFVDIWYC